STARAILSGLWPSVPCLRSLHGFDCRVDGWVGLHPNSRTGNFNLGGVRCGGLDGWAVAAPRLARLKQHAAILDRIRNGSHDSACNPRHRTTLMAEFRTLQFENTAKGQQEKVAAMNQWTQAGWKVVSETITPGSYEGEKGCCLALACLPLV